MNLELLPAYNSGFTKTWMASDWDSLIAENGGHFATLIENRRGIKSAASALFSRKDLEDMAPDKDHFAVHRIIMGSEEAYGPNNNGDGYPDASLDKYHPTFVTNGHVYREHDALKKARDANGKEIEIVDPSKKIGDIKAAKYSKKLQRVELVEHLNIRKAAAEFEAAKAGKELHASQSTHVPYDVCTICKKKAATPKDYCDDLANYMLQYMPAHRKYAFASNPVLRFFDSSVVANPADRTARYLEYRFPAGLKAAGQKPRVITGADWAEFSGLNHAEKLHLDPAQEEWLVKLAALETQGAQGNDLFRDFVAVNAFHEQADSSEGDLQAIREIRPTTLFYKLAKAKVLLPFDVFAAYMLDEDLATVRGNEEIKAAAHALPGVFRKLASGLAGDNCHCRANDIHIFNSGSRISAEYDLDVKHVHDSFVGDMYKTASISEEQMRRRSIAHCNDEVVARVKKASVSVPSDVPVLTELYGMYKIAALHSMFGTPDLSSETHCAAVSAVWQNFAEALK